MFRQLVIYQRSFQLQISLHPSNLEVTHLVDDLVNDLRGYV